MQESTMAEDPHQDTQGRLGGLLASIAKWTGALVSLALIGGLVFWSYRLGVRDAGEVPVIKAGDGPIRAQPDDPGGSRMANQGLEVNQVLDGTAATEIDTQTQLAPASEGVEPGENPVAAEDRDVTPLALSALDGDASLDKLPQAAFDAEGDLVTSMRPRARPTSLDTSVSPTSDIDRMTAGLQPDNSAAADADASGKNMVQLGKFESEELAGKQWERLLQANSDLLGGKEMLIQKSGSGGLTIYRLRVTGFHDLAESKALCAALEPRQVSCIPATGP